jgi:hypothetical protein
MRRASGHMFCLLTSALSLSAIAQTPLQNLKVDYTGSLLGYYRIEPGATPLLTPVSTFLAGRAQNGNSLLLGMGDNFGPEFGASLQNVNPSTACMLPATAHGEGGKDLSAPESLYKDDDRLTPSPACDNVTNFLMQAGYRAVVPGREDFMYTATWLRHTALLLQQINPSANNITSIRNPDGRLHLLGANLRVNINGARKLAASVTAQGKPYSLKGHCPPLFSPDALNPQSSRCTGSNAESDELKWLSRLDRLERQENTAAPADSQQLIVEPSADEAMQAYVAASKSGQESLLSDQVNILLTAWKQLLGNQVKPWTVAPGQQAAEIDKAIAEKIEELNLLLSHLCKASNDPAAAPACPNDDASDLQIYASQLLDRLNNVRKLRANPHATATTFSLSSATRLAAIRGLLRSIAREQENVGYTLANADSGAKVLLIGVIGANTFSAVSQVNRDLCIRSGAAGLPPATWPADFASCKSTIADTQHTAAVKIGEVVVTDPVTIVDAIVRGAQLLHPEVGAVVVMAQMPHTDAEVLSMKLYTYLSSAPIVSNRPLHKVDLVLSEAETGYATGDVSLQFGQPSTAAASAPFASPAPVFTPEMSYSAKERTLPGTVSSATLDHVQQAQYAVTNRRADHTTFFAPIDTAACLLQVAQAIQASAGSQPVPPCAPGDRGNGKLSTRDEASRLELLLMKTLQTTSKSPPDVAFLEARDLQFDLAPAEYLTYDICKPQPAPANGSPQATSKAYAQCVLHVGLDRIFWKGDYIERVAIKGGDLRSMIQKSDTYLNEESELSDRDITGEWLVTFGITQPPLANVTDLSRANEPLWVPPDPNCDGAPGTYCVGGVPLVDDQYYWLLTSDSLAQDPNVYGVLAKLDPKQHEQTFDFLTGEMAEQLMASLTSGTESEILRGGKQSAQQAILQNNLDFEQRRLVQVDFAKAVAAFTSRSPVGGNQFLGAYYQGVSDSRASAPSSQELDLEIASRLTSNVFGQHFHNKLPRSFALGLQSSFAYDRAVIGNLSPATKPINSSYSLNNLSVGAFLQFRLGGKKKDNPVSVRSLPRTLLVLAPRQYQTQINHQYLFFTDANSSPLPGELTVTLPRSTGWSDKVGIRREFGQQGPRPLFGAGNYIEFGGEFVTQNNVLAAVTLADGANVKTCQVSSSITLQTCFSQAPLLVITSNTTIPKPPAVNDLNSPGIYWTMHLQNHLGTKGAWKAMSLTSDAQGDYYFGRPAGAELPTQTEYAIPVSVSLTFPALGNLSFGPTYSGFFYKSQLSSQSLQVNSYSISARWFFSRDNGVPIKRQIRLSGPSSSDQTKTSKVH